LKGEKPRATLNLLKYEKLTQPEQEQEQEETSQIFEKAQK